MSVLIKGMEMPKNGEMKKIIIGRAPNGIEPIAIVTGDKTEFYKIFEVPTPHGRLIGVDAFVKKLKRLESSEEPYQRGMVKAFLDVISCEPTIIEAEVTE